jgi:formylglycine-generating enzyme required for sulfatase activity
MRGGSWNNDPGRARSAYRNHDHPDNRWNNQGFRLALSSWVAGGRCAE